MSADAIKAWAQVTQEQLTSALARIHPDDRPSLAVVQAVGQVMAVGVTARDGYCDMTEGQLFDALKGVYGGRSIKNAVYALRVAGVIATVKGGTVSKDGKGRGAQRVFVAADTKGLIPADYSPPLPRRTQSQTGQDLTETHDQSQTGSGDSQTGRTQSQTGQDLTTPKESLYLSTAAQARPSINTPKDDSSSAATAPPSCGTCAAAALDAGEIVRIALAAYQAVRAERRLALETGKERGQKVARILRAHYPDATCEQLIGATTQLIENYQPGNGLHDHVLNSLAG